MNSRGSSKSDSSETSSASSSKGIKRRIRRLEDDLDGKKIRIRNLIDDRTQLEKKVKLEREKCREKERELEHVKYKLEETKSQLQKANETILEKDKLFKLLESEQKETDKLLKGASQCMKNVIDENELLEKKIIDYATTIVNQKDDLNKAADKISQQSKILEKNEIEMEETRKENARLAALAFRREDNEAKRRKVECDPIHSVVPLLLEQPSITLSSAVSSSILVLPPTSVTPVPSAASSYASLISKPSQYRQEIVQFSQPLPSSTSKRHPREVKVLQRNDDLKSYLRKLHAKTNRGALTVSNFISGKRAHERMLEAGEEHLCKATNRDFATQTGSSVSEIPKTSQQLEPLTTLSIKFKEPEGRECVDEKRSSGTAWSPNNDDGFKSSISSLSYPSMELAVIYTTFRKKHGLDPVNGNVCLCGIPFYNSEKLARHIALRTKKV